MKSKEKYFNFCLGVSFIYWGIAGFFHDYIDFKTSYVRLFITVLNITVGLLFIFRKPVLSQGTISSVLVSIPSLICGGLLFKLAQPSFLWSNTSKTLFIFGGLIALTSFLFLGRNFSIFPRMRSIVSKGMYKVIRHPSYLGEFIMITACLLSREGNLSFIPFVIFIPSIIIRILEEERLLMGNLSYKTYAKSVKWRLIPYVW